MIRTQVNFDEQQYVRAKKEAEARGIALAEFVRRAVRTAPAEIVNAPWMRYSGRVESGNPQASRSIDEIVYGSKH